MKIDKNYNCRIHIKKIILFIVLFSIAVFCCFAVFQITSWLQLRFPSSDLAVEVKNVNIKPVTESADVLKEFDIPVTRRKRIQKSSALYRTVSINCILTNETDNDLFAWRCKKIKLHTEKDVYVYVNKNPYPFDSEILYSGESRNINLIVIVYTNDFSDENLCSLFYEADIDISAVKPHSIIS